ncbi:small GTP-binding protein [Tritrichomonas foetus]|uniref:Small GTP-binding protein n=1 Tax=Tritrichomonas foetus TaxID=1144522 RepID=A0A1J4KL78_9EUKA|nr:small GTP-binding protein [Tritrichomonas foetus]|eukprot:OHT11890.1 small GTP-binding protein [Tritrichomonas foetus]
MVTPTVGSGVILKDINTSKGVIPLKIWDTAGEERYRSFTGLYSQSSNAGIIVFDVTDEKSFESLDGWITEFRNNANEGAILFLAGNKTDLIDEREISFEKASNFAFENKMKYFEVSAKTGENVELLFCDLATELGPKFIEGNENVYLDKTQEIHSGCTC